MIICPPIRTVCESREILLLPLHVCARARFLLVASLARQSRIIIVPSVPSCIFPSSSSFSFFFSFFFFCFFGERGEGGTGARFLKPFEFMTRKNSIGIVPTDPPFLLSLESSRACVLLLIPCSTVSSTFALFPLSISSSPHLPRSIDRWISRRIYNDKIIEIFPQWIYFHNFSLKYYYNG